MGRERAQQLWEKPAKTKVMKLESNSEVRAAGKRSFGTKDLGERNRLKLICFDFDRTLPIDLVFHSLHALAASEDTAKLVAVYNKVSDQEKLGFWGGEQRLEWLRHGLRQLKEQASAKLFVITFGDPFLVEHILHQCDLLQFFDGITEENPKLGTMQVLMNTQFPQRLRADQALLVDDTLNNLITGPIEEKMKEQLKDLYRSLKVAEEVLEEEVSSWWNDFYEPAESFPEEDWGTSADIGQGGAILPTVKPGTAHVMMVSRPGHGIAKEDMAEICRAAGLSAPGLGGHL